MKILAFFSVNLLLLAPRVANAQVYYADLYALTNAYKLYSTADDFYNDKFVEADKLSGKGYTKNKELVLKKGERPGV
jgi:hypothetical protein